MNGPSGGGGGGGGGPGAAASDYAYTQLPAPAPAHPHRPPRGGGNGPGGGMEYSQVPRDAVPTSHDDDYHKQHAPLSPSAVAGPPTGAGAATADWMTAAAAHEEAAHAPLSWLDASTAGGTSSLGVMSMKLPLRPRDRVGLLFFLAHVAGMACVVVFPPPMRMVASDGHEGGLVGRAVSWRAVLALAVVGGGLLAVSCLRTMLYKASLRRSLILQAPRLAALAQGALALYLLFKLPWHSAPHLLLQLALLALLIHRAQGEWAWARRRQEQAEFAAVLAEMCADILRPSKAIGLAAAAALAAQAGFLLLWTLAFTRLLPASAAASLGVLAFASVSYAVVLNLHWVSQIIRHVLHLCVAGPVMRWFYSSNEEVALIDMPPGSYAVQPQQEGEDEDDDPVLIGADGGGVSANGHRREKRPWWEEEEEEDEHEDHKRQQQHAAADEDDAPGGGKARAASGASSSSSRRSRSPSPPPLALSSALSRRVVLHHLLCALTVSLGSVCQAAAAAPFTQWLWARRGYEVVEEELRAMPTAQPPANNSNGSSFAHRLSSSISLSVSAPSSAAAGRRRRRQQGDHSLPLRRALQELVISRHHALALPHVAAYKKPFHRAAQDTWSLIVASGLDSILRDDVLYHSLHALATAAGAFTSLLVLLAFGTGPLAFFLPPSSAPSGAAAAAASSDGSYLSTTALSLLLVLLPWILAAIQVKTALEPVMATVGAAYVCFAEAPELVSQTFPLIFHRLDRIAEARNF